MLKRFSLHLGDAILNFYSWNVSHFGKFYSYLAYLNLIICTDSWLKPGIRSCFCCTWYIEWKKNVTFKFSWNRNFIWSENKYKCNFVFSCFQLNGLKLFVPFPRVNKRKNFIKHSINFQMLSFKITYGETDPLILLTKELRTVIYRTKL